jgi:hypothetical protein
MDTRAFGPSGWQLLHLIAHEKTNAIKFMNMVKDILPCKFCRESTTEFLKQDPPHTPLDKWVYDLHNRVNKKLRDQCREDPRVICPHPDPPFEEVSKQYEELLRTKPNAPPGIDFLFCIAFNYTPEKADIYRTFYEELAEVYPYPELRSIVKHHLPHLNLETKKGAVNWTYMIMKDITKATGSTKLLPSPRGVIRKYSQYTSSCNRGKTCRNGKRKRDHRKTYKVTHARLLR